MFDSWRAKQSDPANYGAFVQQCIVKAFDWLQTKSIELSKIGNICNILAYTNGARAKEEFCVRLIYCLGFALESAHQNEIATKVRIQTHTHTSYLLIQFSFCMHVSVSNQKQLLLNVWNRFLIFNIKIRNATPRGT